MKSAMLGLLLSAFSAAAFSAGLPFGENRFSMQREYELIDGCVGGNNQFKEKAIKICVCTLKKTMENGWWPDYDNDKDFTDNRLEFMKGFRKNRIACQEKFK